MSFSSRPAPCRMGACRGGNGFSGIEALEARTLFSATPVIDVMVVYTPLALSEAGSLAALEARMHRAVADTNLALANSRVNAIVRLVHDAEVNYVESGVIANDLNNVQTGAAGLGGVAALRNQYGADLVSLWVGAGDEAGRAFQPDDFNTPQPDFGYNVVQEHYADDNFVFAHETGHNLGAGHDRSDATPRVIPYAYGKVFTIGHYTVGDIMTNGERTGYYSNPNVSFEGIATGNPDNSAQPADNARVMNRFAPIVAAYRPMIVPDNAAPTAAIEDVAVDTAHQALTVKVEYADDTAVSVASLGTGDVLVGGPGGFRKFAVFAGADFASDGPQRVGTYRLSLAGFSTDPGAYSFTLESGRVRDIYGHAAAGKLLGAPSTDFANRAGPRLATAFDVGALDGANWQTRNSIDGDDPTAFYRFTLSSPAQFTAHLSGLTGNIDELLVQDRNADGRIESNEILSYPSRRGTSPETISQSLAAGTYELWVAPAVAGTSSTYTLSMSAVTVAPPPPGGVVSGTVFDDANADGRYDAGDSPLAGWRVFIDLRRNGIDLPSDPSAVTDRNGNYRITNVPAGAYSVRVVEQSGWRPTAPVAGLVRPLAVNPGQIIGGQNFGQTQRGLVAGSLFDDLNHNGTRQTNEPPLAGWHVVLDAIPHVPGRTLEEITRTDAAGDWSFDDLSPGAYTVSLTAPQGWRVTTPDVYSIKISSARMLTGLLFGATRI